MNTLLRTAPALLVLAITAASCGTMQSVSEVRDDVYYMPSDAPLASTTPMMVPDEPAAPEPEPSPKSMPQDDYYDANSAAPYTGAGSYYDMAYNDPYYYNYGRFGFNTNVGMGWQSGWNGPGWGMSMGYGWGSGMGMGMGYGGMYDPFWNGGFGYGFGYPSWAWRNPGWGWYSPAWSPWYDPWYGGYGYGGPYMGPYGNCFCCYSPVIIGGGSGVVVGHRPSMNSSGAGAPGGGTTSTPPRSAFRDPVGLTRPAIQERERDVQRSIYDRPAGTDDRPSRTFEPSRQPSRDTWTRPTERPSRQEPATRPSRERTPDRKFDGGGGREARPSRDGGGGGGSSPSRDNGGGGGNSGGGSRGGGGGRPR